MAKAKEEPILMEKAQIQEDKPQLKVTQPQEDKYPRAELIANSMAIFGAMPEVVAGALHGNGAEELTIAEVQEAIYNFLTRSVS